MKPASTTRTMQRARALMERCLRPGRASSLAAEFPLIFDERFSGRVVAYEEKGDVRSTCAMIVRDLVAQGARLRVGLLGSVATEGAWRGRGLAARVLEEAEASLAREGCVAAFLWADDPNFYAARGYRPIGWEVDFVVPAALLAQVKSDAVIRALAPDDFAAVQRMYSLHVARVDRSAEETAALLNCPGMLTLVLQRDRDVVAYACLGRGADFPNTVHEWGGDQNDVVLLLAEHARRAQAAGHDGALALIAPPSATILRERMTSLGAEIVEGVLAMAKVIDGEALSELFDRFGGELRAEHDVAQGQQSSVIVRGPLGRCALSDEQALAVLFGVRGDRAAVLDLERVLGGVAPRLPLAPFVWGLDGI